MTSSPGRSGIAVIAVTRGGARLGGEIAASLGPGSILHVAAKWLAEAPPGAVPIEGRLTSRVSDLFPEVEALVFVLATGATVRLVAPLLGSKQDDPAVLCVDEAGRHVVALLGGHQADANRLAMWIADAIGAEPVISTASDVSDLPALDLLGRAEGWRIDAAPDTLKQAAAAILAGERAAVFQDAGQPDPVSDLPGAWLRADSLAALRGWTGPRLVVTDRLLGEDLAHNGGPLVVYRPPTLVLGVGCSLGAPADEIEALARAALVKAGLATESVAVVATIDRRLAEPGVMEVSRRFGARLVGYPAADLASVADLPTPSSEVARHVGTPGVCEPAAIVACAGGTLLVPKRKSAQATVAVARFAPEPPRTGKLWLVGLGPGPLDQMTGAARRAVRSADLVFGYQAYLNSIQWLVPARRLRPSDLGEERQRAAAAIEAARGGRQVALVSSGDVGIYAMAGLVFELLADEKDGETGQRLDVEIVPGVTAASAAAALLGAPLMLDFAAISLSDLLVPWETIQQRLQAAAEGDLVVVLYNPASARRRRPFQEAVAILRARRPPETPVGLVREAYRAEQQVTVTTLGELPEPQVDMRTVVVIGCSRTITLDGRIVTRRGYLGDGERR